MFILILGRQLQKFHAAHIIIIRHLFNNHVDVKLLFVVFATYIAAARIFLFPGKLCILEFERRECISTDEIFSMHLARGTTGMKN